MCGIAGIMYKHGGDGFDTGAALIDMLDGCQHRGPDSTGYALYGDAHEGQIKLRFFIGSGPEAEASGPAWGGGTVSAASAHRERGGRPA